MTHQGHLRVMPLCIAEVLNLLRAVLS